VQKDLRPRRGDARGDGAADAGRGSGDEDDHGAMKKALVRALLA
jgi:hypothetical protein